MSGECCRSAGERRNKIAHRTSSTCHCQGRRRGREQRWPGLPARSRRQVVSRELMATAWWNTPHELRLPGIELKRLVNIQLAMRSMQPPTSRQSRVDLFGWQRAYTWVSSAYWCTAGPHCSMICTTSAVSTNKIGLTLRHDVLNCRCRWVFAAILDVK